MDRFLPILSFLLLSATATYAALPAQRYWDTVLPNTPMPDAIKDFIRPDVLVDEKTRTSLKVGKSTWEVRPDVGGKCHVDPFNWRDAATDAEMHNNPCRTLYAYFSEKQLHPGAKMILQIPRIPSNAAFLPRRAADSIPFSSKKLPQILDHFSIKTDSSEAEAMKKTLHECERPTGDKEHKYCATSLESMVEFSTSILGTHQVQAVSTKAGLNGAPKQLYTVAPSGVRRMAGSELVACHAELYPYAVFYCHALKATHAYTVKLVGADGMALEMVAVCHADTSWWNPKHLAFQVLKVKPGMVTVCHALRWNQIAWAPKN